MRRERNSEARRRKRDVVGKVKLDIIEGISSIDARKDGFIAG
jgi:hypothetical protein